VPQKQLAVERSGGAIVVVEVGLVECFNALRDSRILYTQVLSGTQPRRRSYKSAIDPRTVVDPSPGQDAVFELLRRRPRPGLQRLCLEAF